MNKKHIKYVIIAVIGVVSFSSLLYFNYYIFPYLETPKSEESDNRFIPFFSGIPQSKVSNITMIIDYSGVRPNEFYQNMSLINGQTTVYHALISKCLVTNSWYGPQVYIVTINGIGEGWTYKINGKSPFTACNLYYLKNFDVIEWVYVGIK